MNLNVVKQQSGVIPVGDPDALAKLAKDWKVAAQHVCFLESLNYYHVN
jgi:hypothetical protein